jgi:hypothetical protein
MGMPTRSRIGVGGQEPSGCSLGCRLQTLLRSLEHFWVRVGGCGKVTFGVLLLGHDGDIGDARIVLHMSGRHLTGTMLRAVLLLHDG